MLIYLLIVVLLRCISAVHGFAAQGGLAAYFTSTRSMRTKAMRSKIVQLPRTVVGCSRGMQWFEVTPGDLMALRIHSRDVGGAFTIVEARVLPLSGPPMHVHHERDEIFEVLDGTFRFQCGDDVFDITTGTTVVVPRGVAHSWVNLGKQPARLLFSFVPGGIDELFERIGATPPEQWAALAALHDTSITGPPLVVDGAAEPCRERRENNVAFLVPRV